jgi:hypothetical protein
MNIVLPLAGFFIGSIAVVYGGIPLIFRKDIAKDRALRQSGQVPNVQVNITVMGQPRYAFAKAGRASYAFVSPARERDPLTQAFVNGSPRGENVYSRIPNRSTAYVLTLQ